MTEADQQFGKIALTQREIDILRLLTDGLTDGEIAGTFSLTIGTVKWYNRQIYNKLGVRNRTEASALAQQLGLLNSPSGAESSVPQSTHNLPAPITSFIGRSRELSELTGLLRASRLVTLTGPPGTGKTRLALEVAAALLEHYQDGVYFVSLASIQNAHLVAHTIAQALGVKESGSASILAALKAALQDQCVLLVLDNFEHLLAAAPLVSDLLAALPCLTMLVTSREFLRLYGEQEFPVPPLQLPDLTTEVSAEKLSSFEAIELFTQRARAAQPTFTLSDDNAASIATICIQLDGLPLAIELAAARIKFYSPPTLLVRLSSRLEALGEGSRDRPARQRTLRATLAWSYELLTPEEQSLFARLGVFAGGFSAAAAQAVCGPHGNTDATEGLESLLNKSLLRQMDGAQGEPRFMMLETMREYALEKLDERGERAQMEEQHARYFIARSAEAALAWMTPREGMWLDWLEAHYGSVQATLEWSLTHDASAQTPFELGAHLARFWEVRGYFSEGYSLVSRALARTDSTPYTKAHADAFFGISLLVLRRGDHTIARQLCSDALSIYEKLGDKRSTSFSLVRLSEITGSMGDYESALELSRRGYGVACESDDPRVKAYALSQIGFDGMRLGNFEEAGTALHEALPLFQALNDTIGIALVQSGLGEIAVRAGDFEMAATALQVSLQLREEIGDRWGIAVVLGTLAWAALLQNDLARAAELLKVSIRIRQQIGEQGGIAWCLEKSAQIALIHQDAARAVRTFAAAALIRTRAGSAIDPCDREAYNDIITRLRKRLGRAVWEAVWAEGEAMPLAQFIADLALSAPSSTGD
jgi:predicted ATPase/DNA-binding CsgD family transcriptional regulator